MIKVIKKIIDLSVTAAISLAVVLAFLLAGVRFLGFEIYTVLSGSMEPAYHTGSVIYVKQVDSGSLQPGDVITYRINGGTTATHRIVEIVQDETNPSVCRYRTKGDANNVADGSLVNQSDIIGSPVFTIPYLGFVADYIQNPPGKYLVMSAASFVLLLSFIPGLLSKETERNN